MALSGVETPSMKWTGENLRENWRRFRQHAELMFTGPLKSRSEPEKCSYLLIWSGEKGRDIYNTWTDISEEEQGKLKSYYDRFEQHINPKANPVFTRYKFHKRTQNTNESAEEFITDLRLLAQDCEFNNKDEMIRDRIVIGTNSDKIREKLFDEGAKLTLDTAISITKNYEASQSQLKTMAGEIREENAAIQREHYVIPTLEEILPKLTGAQLFSIVDAKCGYWNVVLDKESSYLTTFNSPFGRYCFKRMPFGLKMSQDIFQVKIDQTFEGCEGVVGIADDIVISGKTEEEHDHNIHAMIKRCKETGLKLNPDKCFIKQEKIKFYGIICGQDGTQPDPDKVSALKQMAPPTNSQELQTFLGLVTYMGPFIKNLSSLTAPLRELLKEKNKFVWSPTYQAAYDKVKDSISHEVTLNYFDPKKEITIQVDASMRGLGAALLQDNKPVAFASKALTDVETRYANIERELLAVVYGCEKFHTYIYGCSFTVKSDHKPLESIHLKHLTAAPPRLQRMLLRLQPYDLVIKYQPGKNMEIADALSRLSPEEKKAIPGMNVQIHEIYPQFSSNMIGRIRENTSTDPELTALKEQAYEGWPQTNKNIPVILKPYWSYRDEITIEDGIAMKGHRIMIPTTMQKEILEKLHSAHQGMEKTKLRARTSVYWRELNKDIEKICKACSVCQELQSSQPKEPLISTEIPPRPWHTIGTDLFYLDGSEYLLIADYYSKY